MSNKQKQMLQTATMAITTAAATASTTTTMLQFVLSL